MTAQSRPLRTHCTICSVDQMSGTDWRRRQGQRSCRCAGRSAHSAVARGCPHCTQVARQRRCSRHHPTRCNSTAAAHAGRRPQGARQSSAPRRPWPTDRGGQNIPPLLPSRRLHPACRVPGSAEGNKAAEDRVLYHRTPRKKLEMRTQLSKSRACQQGGRVEGEVPVARERLHAFASGAHELKAREVGSRLMCSTHECV
jgi:hypothetical protein